MIRFTATIKKFGEQGEKTGWTYIAISPDQAAALKPGNKRSFRVKGTLDGYQITKVALMPMGDGSFVMSLNAVIRKGIRKQVGQKLQVSIEEDKEQLQPPDELIECLKDEPEALKFFQGLTVSHRNYFGNWIRAAKTEAGREKKIAKVVTALSKQQGFPEMIRSQKKNN